LLDLTLNSWLIFVDHCGSSKPDIVQQQLALMPKPLDVYFAQAALFNAVKHPDVADSLKIINILAAEKINMNPVCRKYTTPLWQACIQAHDKPDRQAIVDHLIINNHVNPTDHHAAVLRGYIRFHVGKNLHARYILASLLHRTDAQIWAIENAHAYPSLHSFLNTDALVSPTLKSWYGLFNSCKNGSFSEVKTQLDQLPKPLDPQLVTSVLAIGFNNPHLKNEPLFITVVTSDK
jgi:hypothetical protein